MLSLVLIIALFYNHIYLFASIISSLFLLLIGFFFVNVYFPYKRVCRECLNFINGNQVFEDLERIADLTPISRRLFNTLKIMLNRAEQLRLSVKQSEYLALLHQINPHFLYNTLDCIRGDAMVAGMNDIANATETLSTFFSYSISTLDKLVSLEEELNNVEDYFAIQKYRFGDNLRLDICNHEENNTVLSYRLPKLTLQPIVENAIVHGIENKCNGGLVQIHIEIIGSNLCLRVTDDGIGMSSDVLEVLNQRLLDEESEMQPKQQNLHNGIALKNVNNRIQLLFGNYYGLHIYSKLNVGTDVHIILPLTKKEAFDEKRNPSNS